MKQVKGICFDIDDTFSTDGKIEPDAYAALWKLKRAGYFLVPVTGRPAGWCDHISRFWPVDAVVGENGAFTFLMDRGVRNRIDTPMGMTAEEAEKKLNSLRLKILEEFPQTRFASDQLYRERDLAIDFCEDVKPWTQNEVDRLVEFCRAQGAHAKVSSIHVNTWYGEFDKEKGVRQFLKVQGKVQDLPAWDEWLFIGDSPNDEPLFQSFTWSVGVANLSKFLEQIKHHPRWITRGKSGKGFCQMAQRLLKL